MEGAQRIGGEARRHLTGKRNVRLQDVSWREGCIIHDLRDTYLTGVKGVPLDVLQRVAGHSDIVTTIQFYTTATERDADGIRGAVASSGLAGQGAPGARGAEASA